MDSPASFSNYHYPSELPELDPIYLDDWLENDLRQAGILPNTPPMEYADKPFFPSMTDAAVEQKQRLQNMTAAVLREQAIQCAKSNPKDAKISPQQVAILIKALSLLGSIRYTTNQDVTHCAQEPEVRRYKHERNSKQIKESLSVQAQVALKRQRNTDAARRSRLRKVMKMDALERRVRDLEVDNSQLRLRVASISEDIKDTITEEQRKRQRIQELEAQLAQVHQALLGEQATDDDEEEIAID